MPWVHLILLLALAEYLWFGFETGRARYRLGVRAPATTGNETFERYYRVQMNTQEQLLVFIPSLLLFAWYISPYVAVALGLLFIVGRLVYFFQYVRNPAGRTVGFGLSVFPTLVLLAGAVFGAARATLYY